MIHSSIITSGAVPIEPAQIGLESILRAVRTHLGMEVGFISQFTEGRRVFRHVDAAEGAACISIGQSDPLEESYCHWIVNGKLPGLIRDPPITRSPSNCR